MNTEKTFDTDDMPEVLGRSIHEYMGEMGAGNGSYYHWSVTDSDGKDGVQASYIGWDVCQKIDEWLLANGAEPNEEVLIHNFW